MQCVPWPWPSSAVSPVMNEARVTDRPTKSGWPESKPVSRTATRMPVAGEGGADHAGRLEAPGGVRVDEGLRRAPSSPSDPPPPVRPRHVLGQPVDPVAVALHVARSAETPRSRRRSARPPPPALRRPHRPPRPPRWPGPARARGRGCRACRGGRRHPTPSADGSRGRGAQASALEDSFTPVARATARLVALASTRVVEQDQQPAGVAGFGRRSGADGAGGDRSPGRRTAGPRAALSGHGGSPLGVRRLAPGPRSSSLGEHTSPGLDTSGCMTSWSVAPGSPGSRRGCDTGAAPCGGVRAAAREGRRAQSTAGAHRAAAAAGAAAVGTVASRFRGATTGSALRRRGPRGRHALRLPRPPHRVRRRTVDRLHGGGRSDADLRAVAGVAAHRLVRLADPGGGQRQRRGHDADRGRHHRHPSVECRLPDRAGRQVPEPVPLRPRCRSRSARLDRLGGAGQHRLASGPDPRDRPLLRLGGGLRPLGRRRRSGSCCGWRRSSPTSPTAHRRGTGTRPSRRHPSRRASTRPTSPPSLRSCG